MKFEEARIAAHVCGDGWIRHYIEKNSLQIVKGRRYHRPRIRYEIGFCNTNKNLLKEFSGDVAKIYGIKVRKRGKTDLVFRSKRIFDRLKELGAGGSFDWFVGDDIMKSGKNVKKNWLRAFFDDEGTVDVINSRVRIKSMNFSGLQQAQFLLRDLSIVSSITGQNSDKSWYLTVPKDFTKIFAKRIGFNHSKKEPLLKKIISGPKVNRTPAPTL